MFRIINGFNAIFIISTHIFETSPKRKKRMSYLLESNEQFKNVSILLIILKTYFFAFLNLQQQSQF